METFISRKQELLEKRGRIQKDLIEKARELQEELRVNRDCYRVSQEYLAKQLQLIETNYNKKRTIMEQSIIKSQSKFNRIEKDLLNRIEMLMDTNKCADIQMLDREIDRIDYAILESK